MTVDDSSSARYGVLRDKLITVASSDDDSPVVATDLIVIAQVAAPLIEPVRHASVTAHLDDRWATVAAGHDDAVALDHAQYRDDAGPCLDALKAGRPASYVADGPARSGFPDTATRLGIETSLSIPLFTASGAAVASLNLYGSDRTGMAPLITAVRDVYDPGDTGTWNRSLLCPGGRQLLAGLIAAQGLRDLIGRALNVIDGGTETGDAYRTLREQATRTRTSLTDTAARVLEKHRG